MPAAPEFGYIAGNVRVVEILPKVETKHLPQSNGHIRVAGEVKIYLECVGNSPQPGSSYGKGLLV